jgi:hypothetical protein
MKPAALIHNLECLSLVVLTSVLPDLAYFLYLSHTYLEFDLLNIYPKDRVGQKRVHLNGIKSGCLAMVAAARALSSGKLTTVRLCSCSKEA